MGKQPETNVAEVTEPLKHEILKRINELKQATESLERAVRDFDAKYGLPTDGFKT